MKDETSNQHAATQLTGCLVWI